MGSGPHERYEVDGIGLVGWNKVEGIDRSGYTHDGDTRRLLACVLVQVLRLPRLYRTEVLPASVYARAEIYAAGNHPPLSITFGKLPDIFRKLDDGRVARRGINVRD